MSQDVHENLVTRLCDKIDRNRRNIVRYEERFLEDADVAVVCFGATSRPALGAVVKAREEGLKVGILRMATIWPFCDDKLRELGKQVKTIIVPEMNLGQLAREIDRYVSVPVVRVSKIGGVTHSVQEIYTAIAREMP